MCWPYHSHHVSFGPRIFERSRDYLEKQLNSSHVDFTKGKRKREKERGESESQKYEPTYGPYQRWASANHWMELFGDNRTRAACLKYIRELGLIGYTVTKSSKNSLARMTTAHFLLFSVSAPHLHLTRVLTSRFVALSFVLRPLPTDFRHPPSNGRPPLRNRVARTRWLPFSFEEAGQRNGIGRRAMDDHDRYG